MRLRVPTEQDVVNKKVLVRVDYNVPLKEVGGRQTVADDRRLLASLDTINFLLSHNAKPILISHLGRPTASDKQSYSLKPIAEYLSQKLNLSVAFAHDCVGVEAVHAVSQLQPQQILLLENVRFHDQEEQNDATFAKQLASLAEVYINDAFSSSHRAHASTEGVTHYLPSFAGTSVVKEVEALDRLLTNPPKPFMCVIGGAKISDKVGTLLQLIKVADTVLVGGGVADIFLKAQGIEIHKSYMEDAPADVAKLDTDYLEVAKQLLEATKTERFLNNGYIPLPKIVYPIDVIAAPSPDSTDTEVIQLTHDVADTQNDKNLMYLDIGPKTQQLYAELLAQAGSIFWNGPMGFFEKAPFKAGTTAIAQAMAGTNALTVVGGGDSVAAVEELGLQEKFTYVSLAGGATLEFLAGKVLPGLQPLLAIE